MCQGEVEESLRVIRKVEHVGSSTLSVGSLGAEVFEGSWEILEAITPATNHCEYCGEEVEEESLVTADRFFERGNWTFEDRLLSRMEVKDGKLGENRVESICSPCWEGIKVLADKIQELEDSVDERMEHLYGASYETEKWVDEMNKRTGPVYNTAPTAWKFREES